MIKRLRSEKGLVLFSGLVLGVHAIAFLGAAMLMGTAAYVLRTPHRERKAVELCYCTQSGLSEYECKADATVINVEEGSIKDMCDSAVAGMTKEEILAYIKDDVVLASGQNYGNIN